MPTTERKSEIVKQFGTSAKDVGGTATQIALLTERINEITQHLQQHKKDLHSERGLVLLVGKRRRLLDYLAKTDAAAYQKILKDLNLRK